MILDYTEDKNKNKKKKVRVDSIGREFINEVGGGGGGGLICRSGVDLIMGSATTGNGRDKRGDL